MDAATSWPGMIVCWVLAAGGVQRQARILDPGFVHQTNRPLTQLVRILPRCWHDSHPSVGSESLQNPGRFTPIAGPTSNADTGQTRRECPLLLCQAAGLSCS